MDQRLKGMNHRLWGDILKRKPLFGLQTEQDGRTTNPWPTVQAESR